MKFPCSSAFRHILRGDDFDGRRFFKLGNPNSDYANERSRIYGTNTSYVNQLNEYFDRTSQPQDYVQLPIVSSSSYHRNINSAKIGGARTSELVKIANEYDRYHSQCKCPKKRNHMGIDETACRCKLYRD